MKYKQKVNTPIKHEHENIKIMYNVQWKVPKKYV